MLVSTVAILTNAYTYDFRRVKVKQSRLTLHTPKLITGELARPQVILTYYHQHSGGVHVTYKF